MASVLRVTERQLAEALESFLVRVRSTTGAMGTSSAELADPDETAKVLFATLGRMAALREPHPPYCCGDPDCGGCHRETCEHAAGQAPADKELAAIAAIIPALDHAVSGKWAHGDTGAPAWRVLSYLAHRYGYVLATED